MGTPKALLAFEGEPLIVRVVARLRPLFGEVIVVAAPRQDLPPMPARVVRDEVDYHGPVAGICYGLAAANSELAFITACDLLFPNAPLISHLLSLAPKHDAVVPRWRDRLQPLHAVYRASVLPALREQLAAGELTLVRIFDKIQTLTVGDEELRLFDRDGDSFFNMNTPQDYAEALTRWNERRGGGNPDSV